MREDIDIKIIVGREIEEAGAAFLDAWSRAEQGKTTRQRLLTFESRKFIRQSANLKLALGASLRSYRYAPLFNQ